MNNTISTSARSELAYIRGDTNRWIIQHMDISLDEWVYDFLKNEYGTRYGMPTALEFDYSVLIDNIEGMLDDICDGTHLRFPSGLDSVHSIEQALMLDGPGFGRESLFEIIHAEIARQEDYEREYYAEDEIEWVPVTLAPVKLKKSPLSFRFTHRRKTRSKRRK